jgi:hypothetical protein
MTEINLKRIKRCENCKWWTKVEGGLPNQYTHACYFNALLSYDFYKSDCMNSYELIATGPDFCCLHFEEKE